MSNKIILPFRGEIWKINLDPTVGAEIKKIRPVVVISADAIGRLPLKIVAPITDWKQKFSNDIWHVKIEPSEQNKLSKVSAIDVLQVRGVDISRFIDMIGKVSAQKIEEIVIALAIVVEAQ